MTVFRSNKQIYVQLVDDLAGKTLAAASSRGMEAAPKKELAAKVGQEIAKKAQEAGITSVVFNSSFYLRCHDNTCLMIIWRLPIYPIFCGLPHQRT